MASSDIELLHATGAKSRTSSVTSGSRCFHLLLITTQQLCTQPVEAFPNARTTWHRDIYVGLVVAKTTNEDAGVISSRLLRPTAVRRCLAALRDALEERPLFVVGRSISALRGVVHANTTSETLRLLRRVATSPAQSPPIVI